MDKFQGMNQFLKDKLRAPTMTTHNTPDGGDQQLQDSANALADEAGDFNVTPPFPVPLMSPETRSDDQRGQASEVWLINPPAVLPALGNLVGGGTSEKGSQFAINSIRIDNLSGQWVYFPELGAFVPPNWYGRVMRFDGSRVQRVKFETPGGITANTVDTAEIVRVVFSNDYWDEVDGENIAGAAPTLPSNVVIGGDAGQVQSQAYSADSLSQTLLGLITNARLQAWNPSTSAVDRLRAVNSGVLTVALRSGDGVRLFAAAADNIDAVNGTTLMANGAYGLSGATWQRFRIPSVFKQIASVAIGAGSTQTVWTPAAGLKPRLMGWVVNGSSGLVDAAVTFFETSTTGTFMGETGFIAGLGPPSYVSYGPGGPIVSTSSAVIVAFSSTGITLRGTLFGVEE